MSFDKTSKFSISGVAVAPSPATTGTTLTVRSGEGSKFYAGQRVVLAPVGVSPGFSNAEEVFVSDVTGDVLTIVRGAGDTTAQTVTVFTPASTTAVAAGFLVFGSDTPVPFVDLYVATISVAPSLVVASGRSTAQAAAVASVATFTPAVDSSFEISANALVTTATTHNFTVTCAFTDEANNAHTLTLGFAQLDGKTLITAITNTTGTGPYNGAPAHIRAKAGTAITIATVGTFTAVAYNIEAVIKRLR